MRIRNKRTGVEEEVRDEFARVLLRLGTCERVRAKHAEPKPADPKPVAKDVVAEDSISDSTKPKAATYRRKDLRA